MSKSFQFIIIALFSGFLGHLLTYKVYSERFDSVTDSMLGLVNQASYAGCLYGINHKDNSCNQYTEALANKLYKIIKE